MTASIEQPEIQDPELILGAIVYEKPNLAAHAGRVTFIDETTVIVDFYDWIERFRRQDISVHYVDLRLIFCPDTSGIVTARFGLSGPNSR